MLNQSVAIKGRKRLLKPRKKTNSTDSDCEIVDNITDFIVLDEDTNVQGSPSEAADATSANGSQAGGSDCTANDNQAAMLFYEDRDPTESGPSRPNKRPPDYDIRLQPLMGEMDTPTTSKERPVANGRLPMIKRVIINDLHSAMKHSIPGIRRLSSICDPISDVSFSQFDESLETGSKPVCSTPLAIRSMRSQEKARTATNQAESDTVSNAPVEPTINISVSNDNNSTITRTVVVGASSGDTAHNVAGTVEKDRSNYSADDSGSASRDLRKTDKTIVDSTVSYKVTVGNKTRAKKPEPQSRQEDDSDVILIQDGPTDDSVVFVSETQHTSRLPPTTRAFGSNYIRLPMQESKAISVRARRSAEKRKQKSLLGVNRQHGIQKGKRKIDANKIRQTARNYLLGHGSKESPKKVERPQSVEETAPEMNEASEKRMIIIDANNVAYGHGQTMFSVEGVELCIKYFEEKGFDVKAVCPQMRLKQSRSSDPKRLEELVRQKKVILTPCKNLQGKKTISYDDRFILEIATDFDAAIISNDNYQDLLDKNAKWDDIIRTRVIGYTWCADRIYLPDDPYGKDGPTLHEVLHKKVAVSTVEQPSTSE